MGARQSSSTGDTSRNSFRRSLRGSRFGRNGSTSKKKSRSLDASHPPPKPVILASLESPPTMDVSLPPLHAQFQRPMRQKNVASAKAVLKSNVDVFGERTTSGIGLQESHVKPPAVLSKLPPKEQTLTPIGLTGTQSFKESDPDAGSVISKSPGNNVSDRTPLKGTISSLPRHQPLIPPSQGSVVSDVSSLASQESRLSDDMTKQDILDSKVTTPISSTSGSARIKAQIPARKKIFEDEAVTLVANDLGSALEFHQGDTEKLGEFSRATAQADPQRQPQQLPQPGSSHLTSTEPAAREDHTHSPGKIGSASSAQGAIGFETQTTAPQLSVGSKPVSKVLAAEGSERGPVAGTQGAGQLTTMQVSVKVLGKEVQPAPISPTASVTRDSHVSMTPHTDSSGSSSGSKSMDHFLTMVSIKPNAPLHVSSDMGTKQSLPGVMHSEVGTDSRMRTRSVGDVGLIAQCSPELSPPNKLSLVEMDLISDGGESGAANLPAPLPPSKHLKPTYMSSDHIPVGYGSAHVAKNLSAPVDSAKDLKPAHVSSTGNSTDSHEESGAAHLPAPVPPSKDLKPTHISSVVLSVDSPSESCCPNCSKPSQKPLQTPSTETSVGTRGGSVATNVHVPVPPSKDLKPLQTSCAGTSVGTRGGSVAANVPTLVSPSKDLRPPQTSSAETSVGNHGKSVAANAPVPPSKDLKPLQMSSTVDYNGGAVPAVIALSSSKIAEGKSTVSSAPAVGSSQLPVHLVHQDTSRSSSVVLQRPALPPDLSHTVESVPVQEILSNSGSHVTVVFCKPTSTSVSESAPRVPSPTILEKGEGTTQQAAKDTDLAASVQALRSSLAADPTSRHRHRGSHADVTCTAPTPG